MVNDSPFRALSYWPHVYGNQIKKAEPNPNDSQLGILSIVPIWLMTLLLERCHTGEMFMVTK